MLTNLTPVMTLANSIIGVSVLAMPFCYKQCGIVLATLVLLLSGILSRLACHFLIKSAVMSRRRNFETLAFHAFGHMGKFAVELFMIGFLLGTCIAFFVVVGDLGPQIIGKMINKTPEDIRTSLLITTGIFIVLPLGLLRNIDSLSVVCTATIGFYLCLVLKIFIDSTQHIFKGDWQEHVYYWRPAGILQCLPIFSMALFCQTQLFEIYEAIPNVSLERMNEIVRGAVNMCTVVYLCVGFFGYIAFCTVPFTGNILITFEESMSSEIIKIGFVLSVAFSFPLIIFPCRSSLNSLLFRRMYAHEPAITYMSEKRFRCLTIMIVSISLTIGIIVPNIEFVLGILGSTIGVTICLIFPAAFFISISSKNTNERLVAQAILFFGVWIMVLGTYANLYALEEFSNVNTAATNKPLHQVNHLPFDVVKNEVGAIPKIPVDPIIADVKEQKSLSINKEDGKDIRQEPPAPVERVANTETREIISENSLHNIPVTLTPKTMKVIEKIKTIDAELVKDRVIERMMDVEKPMETVTLNAEEKIKLIERKERAEDFQIGDNLINLDAIQKEESELAADGGIASLLVAQRHEELRRTLEKHKLEQKQMIEEQKEILKDIKEQKQKLEEEKQKKSKNLEVNKPDVQNPIALEKNILKNSAKMEIKKAANINEKTQEAKESVKIKNSNNAVLNTKEYGNIYRIDNYDLNNFTKINVNGIESKNQEIKSFPNVEEIKPNEKINISLKNFETPLENSSNSLKGPILSALSKTKFNNITEKDELDQTRKNFKTKSEIVRDLSKDNNNLTKPSVMLNQYSVPIALKLGNQTVLEKNAENSAKKREETFPKVVHRDILQSHDREKRDLHNIKKNLKTYNNFKDKSINGNNGAICSQTEKLSGQEPESINPQSSDKRYTSERTIIKTNIYLSEQDFTEKVPTNPNIVQSDFLKTKLKDLKFVKTQ
ncbi:putative sodium-coupled neutral amino acid transporter 10 [Prorops nasuta]|uniref:putative sodium-coupled neutral amino acid transporter 10 n=1 Tax=Prorops nasuta TaxID=863751 RepID=UPI0034CE7303